MTLLSRYYDLCRCGHRKAVQSSLCRRCFLDEQRAEQYRPGHFWDQLVVTVEGCWEWQRARTSAGYGVVQYQQTRWWAHRLAWTLEYGPIPDGLWVLHRCDNPPCARPSHLFLGTGADNIRDASLKGRMHPGERNGGAKLTEEQVREVRRRFAAGENYRLLAAEFGISPSMVYNIKNRKAWGRVE